jgi:2-polyprenyl-3-methyl-5-hydroxy-6-metoxy-1,4-benzoquinol methylase
VLEKGYFSMLRYEFIDPDIQINSTGFHFIESFLKMTGRTQIGWHYITDITWIYSHIKDWPRDFKILDAGGGGGPVQFLMAELGFDVTNIDLSITEPNVSYKNRYQITYHILPSFKSTSYENFLDANRSIGFGRMDIKNMIKKSCFYKLWSAKRYAQKHEQWRKTQELELARIGQIKWLKGNICNIPEVSENTFDAVVSLSAIEHIPLENLKKALKEIRRVLKTDARWAVTTSGTEKDKTWFHKPSQSNCFSSTDLEKIFGTISEGKQNPQEILQKYQNSGYLKENLAKFYFKSGKYGMPWGIWDPKYLPVGMTR